MNYSRKIIAIAIPAFIANVSIPLLGLVDTFLMGQWGSSNELAAIALGNSCFVLLYWSFGFLKMGTIGLTATALGQKDLVACHAYIKHGLALALGISLGILLLSPFIKWLLLQTILNETQTYLALDDYFSIRVWGAPFALCQYVLSGWFLGMQRIKTATFFLMFVNFLNIILSYILVRNYDLGASGLAMGTLLAQIISLVIYLKVYQKSHDSKYKAPFSLIFFKKLLLVQGPLFFRTLILLSVFSSLSFWSIQYGIIAVATTQILYQFWMTISFGVDSLAVVLQTLAGKLKAENKITELQTLIKYCFMWSLALSIILTLVLMKQGDVFLSYFSKDPEVVSMGKLYLPWIIAMPVITFGGFLLDGLFLGLSKTTSMFKSVVYGVIFCFLPLKLIFDPLLGLHSLWLALLSFTFFRFVWLVKEYRTLAIKA